MQRTALLLAIILVLDVAASVLLFRTPPLPASPPSRGPRLTLRPSPQYQPPPPAAKRELTVDDFLRRADQAFRRGNPEAGVELYKTALLFEPGNIDAMQALARYYFSYEQYVSDRTSSDSAYNFYKLLLDKYPGEPKNYVRVAVTLLKADRLREAEACAHRGLIEPKGLAEPGELYVVLAEIYKAMGRTALQREFKLKAFEALGPQVFEYLDTALEPN